jgi:flagellar hook-length control protein FliK
MLGMQALWSMADDTGEHKKPTPLNQTSTEDLLPLHMLRMPPPAAVWMQRTAMNSAAPATLPPSPDDRISMSDLDLGADWGGDVLQQLLASDVGASTGANTTGTQGTAYANFAARWDSQSANRADLTQTNTPAADLHDSAARSEDVKNLADKMGQAVGQRILSEMERGQWHLKLSLRPATLGHIEVEMRLRSGEFDAVFTAPNAVTRELLQEGLSKLRETLNQMGMNVANMDVGDGQTGKNGENSTPGSFRGQPASNQAGPAETNPETTRVPSVKDPKDGLDVLV